MLHCTDTELGTRHMKIAQKDIESTIKIAVCDLQEIRKSIVATIAPWWTFGAIFEVIWLVFYGRETKRDFAISAVALIYGAFCFIQALFVLNGTIPSKFSVSARSLAAAGSALNGAWLSVASCIGILTVVDAPNEQIELGGVVLALCAGAGVFISIKTSSVCYPLVLVWALVAVVLEKDRERIMRIFAIVGISLSALAALVAAGRRLFAPKTVSTDGSAPGAQYMTTATV